MNNPLMMASSGMFGITVATAGGALAMDLPKYFIISIFVLGGVWIACEKIKGAIQAMYASEE